MSIEQARKLYRRKIHLKIVGIVVLVAIAYGFSVYKQQTESVAAQSWPQTIGEITESEVGLTSGSTNKIVVYEHEVQYRYNIDGQNYYGSKIKLNGIVSSIYREDIEAKARALPIGSKVKVFYQPGKVNNAYLTLQNL